MNGDFESAGSAFTDDTVPQSVFNAMKDLPWILSSEDARAIALNLVENLGGATVDASGVSASAIPIDLSFGCGDAVLPSAPEHSVARMLLELYLPPFVIAVRRMLQLQGEIERNLDDASIDSLTKLSNRRMTSRALGRLQVGEVVLMIDLDHFKSINDSLGHLAGDEVLRAFGHAIHLTLRGRDFAGRYGGEEFVVVLPVNSEPEPFLERLRGMWTQVRPHDITFSAGISVVGAVATTALADSDAAMYRAKNAGRNRWEWATTEAHSDTPPVFRSVRGVREAAQFVAYSRLEVPEGHQDQIDRAFKDRLGAVDAWPGFIALEVWADTRHPTQYSMVSWWTSAELFQDYMKSIDHRRSHDRIPKGDQRPKAIEFVRFRMVSQ